jgi:hypothetical protein
MCRRWTYEKRAHFGYPYPLLAIIRKRIFLEVGRRVFGGMAELKSKVFQIAVG